LHQNDSDENKLLIDFESLKLFLLIKIQPLNIFFH